jgi:hypothetical protein
MRKVCRLTPVNRAGMLKPYSEAKLGGGTQT